LKKRIVALFAVLFLTACQNFYEVNNYDPQPDYRAVTHTFRPKKVIPAPGQALDSVWVPPLEGYTMGKLEVTFFVDFWNYLDYQTFICRDSFAQLILDRPFSEDPYTNQWFTSYFLYDLPANGFWVQFKFINLFPEDPGFWDGLEVVFEYLPVDTMRVRP
jgi:hypothetical protein